MKILKSIAAVVLGYATIVVGAYLFQDWLFGGLSYTSSPLPDLIIGGGLTALSAVGGGYLLAMVATYRPMLHAVPLILWLCIETSLLYATGATAAPLWFDVLSGSSLVVGVLVGTFVYVRFSSKPVRQAQVEP